MRRRPESDGLRTDDPGDWLCGACVVVHEELLARIGGYDESYFLYWEDVDLGFRAVAAGATVVLREDLVAVHDEGGTHGPRQGRAKSALYYRYNCRNRLLFAARNLDRRGLLCWVLATPAVSWEILLRGGRRQLLQTPSLLGAAARGALAGLAAVLPVLLLGPPRRPVRRPAMLVVHPSSELYGSDRVLLESVGALARDSVVTVALPGPGPLVAELEARGATVVLRRMPVLRKAALRPAGAVRLLGDAVLGLLPALSLLRTAGRSGVYVNTTVLPWWLLSPAWPAAGSSATCTRRSGPAPGRAAAAGADTPRGRRGRGQQPLHRRRARGLVPAPQRADERRAQPGPRPGRRHPGAAAAERAGAPAVRGPAVTAKGARCRGRRAAGTRGPGGIDARSTLAGSVFEGYEWFEEELRAQCRTPPAWRTAWTSFGFHGRRRRSRGEADVALAPRPWMSPSATARSRRSWLPVRLS